MDQVAVHSLTIAVLAGSFLLGWIGHRSVTGGIVDLRHLIRSILTQVSVQGSKTQGQATLTLKIDPSDSWTRPQNRWLVVVDAGDLEVNPRSQIVGVSNDAKLALDVHIDSLAREDVKARVGIYDASTLVPIATDDVLIRGVRAPTVFQRAVRRMGMVIESLKW